MIQYHRKLKSIQESEAEYTDLHGHQRKGSTLESQYNGEDSINGRFLNSINLNTLLQQQNNSSYQVQQKSSDSSQLVQKYLQLSKNSQQQLSHQKTVKSTNNDALTTQNGQQTKPFFDENSIDLSFLNYLNKDEGQINNATNSTNKQSITSKNQTVNPSFISNGQASIQNLNASNNQTQLPTAQTSQVVQEKYQMGVQNINDLANLLVSKTHTPDRVIQNQKVEINKDQKQTINSKYEEIMSKYQSVLQNSYEMPSDADSPNRLNNESVKVTEFPHQNVSLQDSLMQPQIKDSLKQQVINEIKPLVSDRKQNHKEQISSTKNSGIHDVQFLSPSNRQFTFDQNDVRSSGFGSVRYGNDSLLKSNQNLVMTTLNQQTSNSESNYQYNMTSKNPAQTNLDVDDKIKRAQSIPHPNYQQPDSQNSLNQQTQLLKKQSIGHFSLPPSLQPSAKSQQYDQIVQKYLPKHSSQQKTLLNQQSGVNSVLGQSLTNSMGSSQIGGYGVNQSIDSKMSNRERSNSINKIATASELLQCFSTKKNEIYSPQSHQPIGILHNNIARNSFSEKFNTLNSAQTLKGMKDSNTFQNFSINQFEINTHKSYLPSPPATLEATNTDGIPQYIPMLLNNNKINSATKSIFPQSNYHLSEDFKTQAFNLQHLNTIELDNQQKTLQFTNNGYSYDKNLFTQTSDMNNFSKSTYNSQIGFTDINGIKSLNLIPNPSSTNILNNPISTSASQYIRSNNHIQSMSSFQNLTNPLDQQLARRFSGHNQPNQPLIDNLIFQRRSSFEKQLILDSKSLLQLRDQQNSQTQKFQIYQQPLQILSQQSYQNKFDSQALKQQTQNFQQQSSQIQFVPQYPIQQQPLIALEQKISPQIDLSKTSILQNKHQQIPIPPTLSPISTPRRNRIESINQNQFANDLDLEFKEFLMNQTKKPLDNIGKQEEVKRTLQQSKSQPFIPLNIEQPQIRKEPLKSIDLNQPNNKAIIDKPKRKIFEENSQNPYVQKNATMRMNQQTLKNVLNFNKNNQLNEQNINQRESTEQYQQPQQIFSARDVQSEQQSKKSDNSITNEHTQSSKNKYYVPPKDENILNKYFNKSPSQPKENTPFLTSTDLDKSPQKQRITNRISTQREINNQSNQKNNIYKKSLNIFDLKPNLEQPRKSEMRFDESKHNRISVQFNTNRFSSRNAFAQKENVKDQIRTIQTDDEEFEEQIKQQKMSKSKNIMKIFTTSPITSSSGLQTIQSPKIPDSQRMIPPQPQKAFSHSSQQQYNPNITENDRKTLQIAEQKLQINNQDATSKSIPILCIDCDNFYEKQDIENHICIPSQQTNNSLNNQQSERYNFKSNKFCLQNYLSEEQFNFELSMINDKISVIKNKINEQPYSEEQFQIKQLLENILNPKISYEDLSKDCRSLNQINKSVDNMKQKNGISLLILSQRAEILIKDKIDLNKKRLFPQQKQINSNNHDIKSIDLTPQSQTQLNSNRDQQVHEKNNNNFIQYNEGNNNNKNNNNKEFDLKESIYVNQIFSNRDERPQLERMTANPRNQTNYTQNSKIFSNNIPSISSIPSQKFDNPSVQGANMNIYSHTKNQAIFSSPIQKIFSHRNIPEMGKNIPNNYKPSSLQFDKPEIDSNKPSHQQSENQYGISITNSESKEMVKQMNQSQNNNVKSNDSQSASNKRAFYNIALNLKLKLAPNHPARDCIISEMFNQAEKQNLSENNFTSFIENYFKQFS